MNAKLLEIEVIGHGAVSALWQAPETPTAVLALAHGAGAGMMHRHMADLADGLAERDVATLRYQFLFMEKGSRRPDAPALAYPAVRAAVGEARRLAQGLPLFAGGRSFGARMTSQAQALEPLAGVRGLVFFAFPLHPAGKPAATRAEHLSDIAIPMLFLSGSKDALAQLDLLQPAVAKLRPRATLELIDDADHAFHVPTKSGRTDADVLDKALDVAAKWMTPPPG